MIKLYLSFFSIANAIQLAVRLKKSTLLSISLPHPNLDLMEEMFSSLQRKHLIPLLMRYVPSIRRIPLHQGLEWVPTWKSTPTMSWYSRLLARSGSSTGVPLKRLSRYRSIFPCLFAEIASFSWLCNFVNAYGEQWCQGSLWEPITRYAFDSENKYYTAFALDWFERRIGQYLPSPEQMSIPPIPGRLASACTGSGKRRLFAIGNYVNQRLLHPVHEYLGRILCTLKTDGTYDQCAPLDRLASLPGVAYSIDLTAATDRWPLLLLFELIQALFDRSFASAVVNSTLGTNVFMVSGTRKPSNITFTTGQPLGYHASWPLFALSHHMMVWYAAEKCYPGQVFDRYALLGDDIVIFDERVANVYLGFLKEIRVDTSRAKSLISPTGCVEFAKRFRVRRATVDLSPVSFKKVLAFYDLTSWYSFTTEAGNTLRRSTLLRLAGVGFKTRSIPFESPKHRRKSRRLIVMFLRGRLPSTIWLTTCFGRVLSPQLIGRVIWEILDSMYPKDLILPPSELYPYPGMADFNEWSVMKGWMKQWLKYVHWYAKVYSQPDVTLDDLFDAPVYVRTWYIPAKDQNFARYGIAFRAYDLVSKYMDSDVRVLTI